MNPPKCPRCGLPVDGVAANEPGRLWHGDCYALAVHELHGGVAAASMVGQTSHDDRVADGLEYP